MDIEKLQSPGICKTYAQEISSALQKIDIDNGDVVANWQTLSSNLIAAATHTLGVKPNRHEDWFDDNDQILTKALQKHRSFLRQHRDNHQAEEVKCSGAELRKYVREIKDKWWRGKAERMQWLADTKQLGSFYEEVRKLVGTAIRTRVPLRSLDGTQLLTNRSDVLNRWGEHFNTLLNVDRAADITHISSMASLPTNNKLDEPLGLREVVVAIQQQQNKKAVGIDNIAVELIKYGGGELHESIWKLFVQMWDQERVPDDFRVSRIGSLYKNKGDRSDFNS